MRKEQRKKQLRRKLAIVCTCSLAGFAAIFGGISLKREYDQRQEEKLRIEREEAQKKQEEEEAALDREKRMQEAMLSIKKKFGKNAVLKGMNLQEGATAKDRNEQIGGHKA